MRAGEIDVVGVVGIENDDAHDASQVATNHAASASGADAAALQRFHVLNVRGEVASAPQLARRLAIGPAEGPHEGGKAGIAAGQPDFAHRQARMHPAGRWRAPAASAGNSRRGSGLSSARKARSSFQTDTPQPARDLRRWSRRRSMRSSMRATAASTRSLRMPVRRRSCSFSRSAVARMRSCTNHSATPARHLLAVMRAAMMSSIMSKAPTPPAEVKRVAVDDIDGAPQRDVRERPRRRPAGCASARCRHNRRAGRRAPDRRRRPPRCRYGRRGAGSCGSTLIGCLRGQLVGVAARADDDEVGRRRIAQPRNPGVMTMPFEASIGSSSAPTMIQRSTSAPRQRIGRAQRLDDRAERHHRKAGKQQHREAARCLTPLPIRSAMTLHAFSRRLRPHLNTIGGRP